jgi:hypothetical protein
MNVALLPAAKVAAHFEEALFSSYREHMMCITLEKLRCASPGR